MPLSVPSLLHGSNTAVRVGAKIVNRGPRWKQHIGHGFGINELLMMWSNIYLNALSPYVPHYWTAAANFIHNSVNRISRPAGCPDTAKSTQRLSMLLARLNKGNWGKDRICRTTFGGVHFIAWQRIWVFRRVSPRSRSSPPALRPTKTHHRCRPLIRLESGHLLRGEQILRSSDQPIC